MAELTRILFVGDIALGGEFADFYCGSQPRVNNPFADLRHLFDTADLTIGNLETPLAQGHTLQHKRNSMCAPPESVRFLKHLGVTGLCLANNHITDQGAEGIVKTRALLTNHGIESFGVGQNLENATKPAFVSHEDNVFGCLGYAIPNEDVGAVIAGDSEEGCAPFSIDSVEKDIAKLRSRVSHVIVSLHWGYQYDFLPSPEQIKMARRIIDAGALIVHGHHPHVVQGFERYRNGMIMYSLGDFIFPDFKRTDGLMFRFPKKTRLTAAVMCEFNKTGVVSHTVWPLRVNKSYSVKPSQGFRHTLDMKALSGRSKVLTEDNYEQYWQKHHEKTCRFREKQERLLGKRLQKLLLREQILTDGFKTKLKRIPDKRLGELIKIMWRYFSALFSPGIR